jgi:hypothetical protein
LAIGMEKPKDFFLVGKKFDVHIMKTVVD